MSAPVFDVLRKAIDDSIPVAVVTVVKGDGTGNKLVVLPDSTVGSLGSEALDTIAIPEAKSQLHEERSITKTLETDAGEFELFYEVFPAPPTLLIFGAVHVGQALATVGKLLGFVVIVTDARPNLLTEERFPMADRLIKGWPQDAIAQLDIDRNTYVAVLTHDPKFDEPALAGVLATDARYVGATGSRKASKDRLERLAAAGLTEEQLARIHSPVGLNIGARTPEEMAISIFAEMIAVRHGRDGQSLVAVKGDIKNY